MPKIMVDRHAIVPAKDRATLDLEGDARGAVLMRIEHDGVRVVVAFDPGEAQGFGVGLIVLAHDAARLRSVAPAAPTSPAQVEG